MRARAFLSVLGIIALTGAAQAADQALVIGVNKYPGLRPGSDLNGCVPDAQLMKTELEAYNFQVTIITDEQATKQGILTAISELKGKVSGNDKVVIYFAGHGTTDGADAAILPNDAKDAGEGSDIKTKELYDAVEGIQTASRTLILDSCHSGGMIPMSARAKGVRVLKPRFYVRTKKRNVIAMKPRGTRDTLPKNTKSWQVVEVNGADNLNKTTGGDAKGEVVYFTAAMQTQVSNETMLDGVPHGVFTYNLAKKLDGKADLWKDIQGAVAAGVSEATDGQQTPVLAPSKFLEQPLFQNGGQAAADSANPMPAKDPQPQASTPLSEVFMQSVPDEALLKLEFNPQTSPIKIGEKVKMKVTVGTQEGYLVVVDRDPLGKLQLMYPMSGGVDAAKVTAGQVVNMPADASQAYTADTEGTDSVKAFLFSSAETAAKLIGELSGARGRNVTLKDVLAKRGTKSWNLVRVDEAPAAATPTPAKEMVTSEIITQIAKDQTQ
ncbi:MAG: caspase family protein [Armatimonas sp.]